LSQELKWHSQDTLQHKEVDMSTGAIIAIVVVLAVIAAAVFLLLPVLRGQQLRRKFGPEYERAVQDHGDRRAAERELADREKRHARYELRSLSPDSRDRYREDFTRVQERFVESPAEAVAEADRLVNVVVAELGYPPEGYERQLADLSVRHPKTVGHYRTAHDARLRRDITTDGLREALLSYRTVLHELLDQAVHTDGNAKKAGKAVEEDEKAVVQR
jgi:hypothetical protein